MHAAHELNGPTYAHSIQTTAEVIAALPMTSHFKIGATQPNQDGIDYEKAQAAYPCRARVGRCGRRHPVLHSSGACAATDDPIRPFQINIPETDLIDLRRRLEATRWSDRRPIWQK
jgi:hypothetical protein